MRTSGADLVGDISADEDGGFFVGGSATAGTHDGEFAENG